MSGEVVALMIVGLWVACVLLGVYVNTQKHRSAFEAFVIAGLFGVFGVLVLLLLPNKDLPAKRKSPLMAKGRDALPRKIDQSGIDDIALSALEPRSVGKPKE